MTYLRTLAAALWLAIVAPALGQTNTIDLVPTADSTIFIVGQKSWSVHDLSRVALAHVKTMTGTNLPSRSKVVLNILPLDRAVMCEFTFYENFDHEFWVIQMGHDGTVKRASKGIMREGRPKPLKPSK